MIFELPFKNIQWITTKEPTNSQEKTELEINPDIHLSQTALVQLQSEGFCAFSQLRGELPQWEMTSALATLTTQFLLEELLLIWHHLVRHLCSILTPDDPQLWDLQMRINDESDWTSQNIGCGLNWEMKKIMSLEK